MNLKARNVRRQLQLLKPFLSGCSLETLRRGQDLVGGILAMTHRKEVDFEEVSVDGIPACWVYPHDETRQGVILYLHGGGYTCGDLEYAKGFASVLAAECGIRVFCIAYRLAPETPFPGALEDARAAFGYLCSHGFSSERIVLCGESAGGGLCYSLCQSLASAGERLPCGVIAISPWTDLTLSGESLERNRDADPSLTNEALAFYADCYTKEPKNPLVSPLFGDLSAMPPSFIFAGGDEILLSDSVRLRDALVSAGREAELIVRPGMWHAYPLYCLREYRDEPEHINCFLTAHLPVPKKLRWMRLDNAAKIYPAAKRRNWSNLFRLSATLTEPVDRAVLRSALDVTVRRFPSIAVRIRRGAFWYYLEELPKAPEICEEKAYPLAMTRFRTLSRCAFRVLVWENRIAVEFFHAITDGNGGLVFLKSLTAEYLKQKYGAEIPAEEGVLDRLEPPREEEFEDSFLKYAGSVSHSRKEPTAYRISGTKEPDFYRNAVTVMLSSEQVRKKAKEYGVTLTVFLAAAMMQAILEIQKDDPHRKKKPVRILIPVNLRKLFPSKTLRNFALFVTPGADPCLGEYRFEELCRIVHHTMGAEVTPKQMQARITSNVRSERIFALKIMPLFIKNAAMKAAFHAVGERKSCLCLSNLGEVKVPDEMRRYVSRMDFVLGVQAQAAYNCGVLSYGDTLYLNFIRDIQEPLLEAKFYQVMREQGIRCRVESNQRG